MLNLAVKHVLITGIDKIFRSPALLAGLRLQKAHTTRKSRVVFAKKSFTVKRSAKSYFKRYYIFFF